MTRVGVETRTVTTADGRTLCVEIAGEGLPNTVLMHRGTPNSRHLLGSWIDDADARAIQLICYDRPGYGGSTALPGRSIADGVDDVVAIADELGLDRFAVWGWSGGGPYSLACAALLPERVVAAAVLGSFAPWGSPGLDFFAGMGQDNVDEIKLYFDDPEASRQKGIDDWPEYMNMTADQLGDSLATLLSPVDAAVVTGEFAEWLARSQREGLADGDQGWWDDGVAHMDPWGFDLESIGVPVIICHGGEDRFVPFQHGQWLAEHVPGAESLLSETDGHLSLVVERNGEVLDWLVAHL
jgi:pimeloyl-ACP methyl ester carboxylesterase